MRRRILVVDDDREIVRTLCDILRLRGWEPIGAYSGEEAVEAQREHQLDRVLMDVRMPGIDGIAASRAIRAMSPGAQVILMTAHTAPEDLAAAREAGVAEVLSKPVDVSSLLTMLAPD